MGGWTAGSDGEVEGRPDGTAGVAWCGWRIARMEGRNEGASVSARTDKVESCKRDADGAGSSCQQSSPILPSYHPTTDSLGSTNQVETRWPQCPDVQNI